MAIVSLLNRGNRGPGTFTTSSVVVDPSVQSAYVVLDPHQSELGATKLVKVDAYVSDDDGQTWRWVFGFVAQGPWASNSLPFTGPGNITEYHGKRVRAAIDLPQQINCGVLLYVNETPPVPPDVEP